MKYKILITEKAKSDLNEAADYIEYTLLNSKAADNLINSFEKELTKLVSMPEKHQLVNEPVLAAWGIRMIVINSYLAFYTIDMKAKTITLVRFLYGKRNWISILYKDTEKMDWTVGIQRDGSSSKQR